MVCINKVKNQIMKKAKWISFGCLLGIILATGSCKETLQNALGKDISVKNREIVFDVQPSALSQTDADEQDVPELLAGATEEVLYDGILNVNVAAELEKKRTFVREPQVVYHHAGNPRTRYPARV